MPGLMGIERLQTGYNGQVMVNGQPVQVKNGKASVQGRTFKVSKNGMVTSDGHLVGQVIEGQFHPSPQFGQNQPGGQPS